MSIEAITSFAFDSAALRSAVVDGEPVFVVKDVCEILGISKHRDAFLGVPSWGRSASIFVDAQTGGKGSAQTMSTVNEAGLYFLAFRSTKPNAQEFQRWVCKEVLPEIRKRGGYVIGGETAERIAKLKELLAIERRILDAELHKRAALKGKAKPQSYVRPPVELAGAVVILDHLRSSYPKTRIERLRGIVQAVFKRLQKQGIATGRAYSPPHHMKRTARPEDINRVLTTKELADLK